MNRRPKALNERNNNFTTSKKTLEDELFPFFEVRNKQHLGRDKNSLFCIRDY